MTGGEELGKNKESDSEDGSGLVSRASKNPKVAL